MTRFVAGHEMTSRQFGMRVILLLQQHTGRPWALADFAELVRERYSVSRATAYRVAREALDAMAITPMDSNSLARMPRAARDNAFALGNH